MWPPAAAKYGTYGGEAAKPKEQTAYYKHPLLLLKGNDSGKYEVLIDFGSKYLGPWDDPVVDMT